MQTSYQDVIRDMQSNKYAPLYFLQSEEPFFIDQIVDFIENNALEESQRSFNQMVLYGKECKIADVLNNARRFPVMAERQVVIVKEAQEITDLSNEAGRQLFTNYVKNPVPSTILVFAYKYKKLDQRSFGEAVKAIKSNGVYFVGEKLYDNKIDKYIQDILDRKGLKADQKAVLLIAENIGLDLSRINNELEKIRLGMEKGEVIDEAKVARYVGISREYNTWELQKAFAKGDKHKIFAIIDYFEKNPKAGPFVLVLGTLYNLFSKIMVIQHANYSSPKALQSEMGMNYYAAQEYFSGSRFYPRAKLPKIISDLRYADAQAKGVEASQMKDADILRELALKILS
jgi:DNA polymerase-3 subunit delta